MSEYTLTKFQLWEILYEHVYTLPPKAWFQIAPNSRTSTSATLPSIVYCRDFIFAVLRGIFILYKKVQRCGCKTPGKQQRC